ncbi:uncharacterized protein LOC129586837 [Paramacrobiotus metropolitanus]|uniref:uncharacterized protein LOC129586837 n=1 Tax=Paramacrobiotus metropolitanus TaxID=2943436 RepID=UPI0024463581|nr:uncharacterized protein LOC129586837 [Paramacrobiotus metropolitanus]
MQQAPQKASQANVTSAAHKRQSRPSLGVPKAHKSEHQHQISTTEGLDSVRSEIDEARKTLEEATQFLHNTTMLSGGLNTAPTDGINFDELRSKLRNDPNAPSHTMQGSVSGDLEQMLEELSKETGGNDPDIQQLRDVWDTTKFLSYQFEAVKKKDTTTSNPNNAETK